MKKIRETTLLVGLFVAIFLVSVSAGWAYGHRGGGYYHHGRVYHHHGWRYYRYYEPVPVPVYPYYYHYGPAPYHLCYSLTLSVINLRSCASFMDQRMVTIDVKDSDGNFIGTVSRPFYVDSSRAEVWNITLNDIQR
ncbi:MAG: hypothetical protein P8Y09_07560 [Deltaproteobacteria bacterium]